MPWLKLPDLNCGSADAEHAARTHKAFSRAI